MDKKETLKILELLFSSDEDEVIYALSVVKEKGSKKLLNIVFQLLNTDISNKVQEKIFDISNNLRDKTCAQLIIDCIKNPKFNKYTKEFVSSCWLSRLNYGLYLPVFINVFIENDFLSAFEAFTVVENIDREDTTIELVSESIEKLKSSEKQISKDKIELYPELLNALNNLK